jgi:hypothetical protein
VAVAGGMFWKAAAMGQPTVEVMSVDSQWLRTRQQWALTDRRHETGRTVHRRREHLYAGNRDCNLWSDRH